MVFVLDYFVAKPEIYWLLLRTMVSLLLPPLKKVELKASVIRESCILGVFGASAVDAVQDGKAVSAGVSPLHVSSVAGPSARADAEVVGGDATPLAHVSGGEGKPVLTLPRFDPLSAESSASSKLDARLKWRLARLKMEREERREEREFQLRREVELKKAGT